MAHWTNDPNEKDNGGTLDYLHAILSEHERKMIAQNRNANVLLKYPRLHQQGITKHPN